MAAKIKIKSSSEYDVIIIGDGAGITRGLMQTSISGVIVAREIKKRLS